MTADQKLAHALKLRFGMGPNAPSNEQLQLIKSAIQKIKNPTEKDWADVVKHYCPCYGLYKYAGMDNSDLNTLLALAIQTTRG